MRSQHLLLLAAVGLSAVNGAPQAAPAYTPAYAGRMHARTPNTTPPPEYSSSSTWLSGWKTWLQQFLAGEQRPEAPPAPTTPPRADRNTDKYINDIVLRFDINGTEDAQAMSEAVTALYLDVWSNTKDHVDVRMSKDTLPLLLDYLPDRMNSSYTRIVHSLLESVIASYPKDPEALSALLSRHDEASNAVFQYDLFFQDYRPLSVIVPWMKLLQSMYPDIVKVVDIGESYEGRPIHVLQVGKERDDKKGKKSVLITGASHAREWISVSTVTYMAYQMITGYGRGDAGIDDMVNNFNWLFVPTLNVDGYEYSWTTDRLWRKNRQPTSVNWCKGIDLDRSYDYHFDSSRQSASNPCSDFFPGHHSLEATESRLFSDWIHTYTTTSNHTISALLDLHSYSQQILYPYSHSCSDTPPDLENLQELAIGLAKAIRVSSGERYETAPACEGTGFASFPGNSGSGSMLDYMYAKMDIPYAYQVKLRDTGNHGFLLPKQSIVPTGNEMWGLVKYLAQFLMEDRGEPRGWKPEGEEKVVETELR